ncbi:MAG TPA: hypothetical protein PKX92_05405 [Edaphocola sp.]|nr:hypothetical protein [Edaphocola sp.]
MNKILITLFLSFSLCTANKVIAQDVDVQELNDNFLKDAVFDGISGVMIYSIYQNNNLLMDLFNTNTKIKDATILASGQQLRLISYVKSLVDNKLVSAQGDLSIKKSDQKYLKNLKSAIIILGNQANGLNKYVNGDAAGKRQFDNNKKLASKLVYKVINKQ